MGATILAIDSKVPQSDVIARAVDVLRSGGLVAFPTETVYGLGANALEPSAVARIFAAKGRPSTNPLIVHVAGTDEARKLTTHWSDIAERLTERFWPGPLTIVLSKRDHVPNVTTAGGKTVALRAPAHPVARALIEGAGFPLAAPSANASTRISATSAEHVVRMLGERIDMVLDGGPCPGGLESTVVDASGEVPMLLRPGLISEADLESALGMPIAYPGQGDAERLSRSPGTMERHYAPTVPLTCVETGGEFAAAVEASMAHVGTITYGRPRRALSKGPTISLPVDVQGYSAQLYDALHRMEQAGVEQIILQLPPDEPEWQAVRDRLRRASWR